MPPENDDSVTEAKSKAAPPTKIASSIVEPFAEIVPVLVMPPQGSDIPGMLARFGDEDAIGGRAVTVIAPALRYRHRD